MRYLIKEFKFVQAQVRERYLPFAATILSHSVDLQACVKELPCSLLIKIHFELRSTSGSWRPCTGLCFPARCAADTHPCFSATRDSTRTLHSTGNYFEAIVLYFFLSAHLGIALTSIPTEQKVGCHSHSRSTISATVFHDRMKDKIHLKSQKHLVTPVSGVPGIHGCHL